MLATPVMERKIMVKGQILETPFYSIKVGHGGAYL
jgi:hypothetical protein